MPTYEQASTEPLESICRNECETDVGSLATNRFRALWNEIERLRSALREIDAGIYNDNGAVTSIGDIAIRKIAQTALQPKE